MSRIGKKPIVITGGVQVSKSGQEVSVKGPKGELSARIHDDVGFEIKDNQIFITPKSDAKVHRALHGLWRALMQNMVTGVTDGYQRKLELVGVGYKAEMKGKKVQLALGYSHPILFSPPESIKIETPAPTSITISGTDKALVGQVAAKIRSFRPPEPYKGKGIKYEGEYIRRKAGKAAAAGGSK